MGRSRSRLVPSQVLIFSLTCDAISRIYSISVAVPGIFGDLRRFTPPRVRFMSLVAGPCWPAPPPSPALLTGNCYYS